MDFEAELGGGLILIAAILLWAMWSKLDLGLRPPSFAGVWPWILLFIAWTVVEAAILAAAGMGWIDVGGPDPEWLQEIGELSLAQELVLVVLLGPLIEELFFRGALFSALMRRWGMWTAALVPSLAWGLLHPQYPWWFITSIAGSGVVLAIIRWKSGSIHVPLALHSAYNLMTTLLLQWPSADA